MTDDASPTDDIDPASETVHEPLLVHGVPAVVVHGQTVVHPTREQYHALVQALHDEGYLLCVDLTAVDYLTHPRRQLPTGIDPERFEVVVGFVNLRTRQRMRLRVQVPADDPTLPTLWDLYPGTEALEREVFDMFGVAFDGHPDLTRILMPEDWVGHPLRKDYNSGRIPVQFKAVPSDR
jgi:NADH-quinone oxidoreductase subunit C